MTDEVIQQPCVHQQLALYPCPIAAISSFIASLFITLLISQPYSFIFPSGSRTLYLAHEYNMPYLVKLAQLDFVKRQAKEARYNIKFVPLSRPQIEGMRLRTILKDECIKTKEAREYIGKYINIIGIEEI